MEEQTRVLSRRGMMVGLGATAAAGAVAATSVLQFGTTTTATTSWWTSTTSSASTMADWSAQVGTTFTIASEYGAAAFTLVSVEPFSAYRAAPRGVRTQPFVAVFQPGRTRLPAGDKVYKVNHSALGDMQVYFSATAGGPATNHIEAVFS